MNNLTKKLEFVRAYLKTWEHHCPYLRIRKYKNYIYYTWEENHTEKLTFEEFENLFKHICERIMEDKDFEFEQKITLLNKNTTY